MIAHLAVSCLLERFARWRRRHVNYPPGTVAALARQVIAGFVLVKGTPWSISHSMARRPFSTTKRVACLSFKPGAGDQRVVM